MKQTGPISEYKLDDVDDDGAALAVRAVFVTGFVWHATSLSRVQTLGLPQGLPFRFFSESRQLPETKFRPKFR